MIIVLTAKRNGSMRWYVPKNMISSMAIAAMFSVELLGARTQAADELITGFATPPLSARTRAYWWWLNGNVTQPAITKDLEWMKQIGMGGGLVFDAGGATQGGHSPVPAGPLFGSADWRKLFVHALREADRLGLEIGLNLQSGWNLGGPMVPPEKAAKLVVWSETRTRGPAQLTLQLPPPKATNRFYRDTFVLALPLKSSAPNRPPIRQLAEKSASRELGGSATDCSPLLDDVPASPGEEDAAPAEVLDLTEKLLPDGTLRWDAPAGQWLILRFGYTNNGARVSTASGDWNGLVLDYLDADALRWYWGQVIAPILADAGPLAGQSWKMVQTDSWELGGTNWTADFPAEFKHRRGYDIRPWLPVLAGRIIGDRDSSNRFLTDLRRTIADCIADNHYGTMASLARQHGLGIQPESAGPHTAPLDGLLCYGRSTWPMSEFWVPSPHRPTDGQRFFVKQASSAAHIYGKPIVCAEGFTSIGPQWNDVLWSAQKPSFDHEACAGLNLVFWHAFTCSPAEMGLPGQEYFAGTHFNPQITWAKQAHAFIGYLNRCQFLLQQGAFVADVLYYYGDHVPNIARLKQDDPAKVLPQYDYDVINEEMLMRASVKNGRVTLPDGMSYRVLALPAVRKMSLEVAAKLRDLAAAGATIVGPKPEHTTGRQDDAALHAITDNLWDNGKITTRTAKEALTALGVQPDFDGDLDWIHRRAGDADIYFLSNRQARPVSVAATFRVNGKLPELWDAVTGSIREAADFSQHDGRTVVPLEMEPYGSLFVVFRQPGTPRHGTNFPQLTQLLDLGGAWDVSFDPHWQGPDHLTFDHLVDWTQRPEDSIRFYSGTAIYRKTFDVPQQAGRIYLSLGELSMLAEVRLNGHNLGVLWCPPFRVDITDAVKPAGNLLEVSVVNSWYNRLIKDQSSPETQRLTATNIRLKANAKPAASGLLGPVRILSAAP